MASYILIFFLFNSDAIQTMEFTSRTNCEAAGHVLMDLSDDKDEAGTVTGHNALYRCVTK